MYMEIAFHGPHSAPKEMKEIFYETHSRTSITKNNIYKKYYKRFKINNHKGMKLNNVMKGNNIAMARLCHKCISH